MPGAEGALTELHRLAGDRGRRERGHREQGDDPDHHDLGASRVPRAASNHSENPRSLSGAYGVSCRARAERVALRPPTAVAVPVDSPPRLVLASARICPSGSPAPRPPGGQRLGYGLTTRGNIAPVRELCHGTPPPRLVISCAPRELGARARGAAAPRGARARDGRRGAGRAPARVGAADGARAHRAAVRPGHVPRDRRARGQRELRGRRARRLHPGEHGRGPRATSRAAPRSCRATTSPSAAARPTRPSGRRWSTPSGCAHELRLPLVRLVDGTGGGGSVKSLEQMGYTYVPSHPGHGSWSIANLARGAGRRRRARAGGRAGRRARGRLALLRDRARHVAAVRRRPAGGRRRDGRVARQGGARRRADAQTRAGAVDNEAADEDDALDQIRRFLSYLPPSAWELPPIVAGDDPADRSEEALLSIVPRDPRKPYDMRAVLRRSCDRGSVFELGARHGRSLICALARLDGHPVGVLGLDPKHYGGGLTGDASDKLVRFVDLCDQFHLPVVNLVDQPGFVIGTEAERAGTMRRGARALFAVYQASVPWVSVLIRKVYGVAGAAHGNASRLNLRYAWPSGDWGSLPIAGGLEAAYRRELEAAEDPVALRAEIEARLDARALAVPHRRALRRRGDHRPARHAPAAVRLGGARERGLVAPTRPQGPGAAPLAACARPRAGRGTWSARSTGRPRAEQEGDRDREREHDEHRERLGDARRSPVGRRRLSPAETNSASSSVERMSTLTAYIPRSARRPNSVGNGSTAMKARKTMFSATKRLLWCARALMWWRNQNTTITANEMKYEVSCGDDVVERRRQELGTPRGRGCWGCRSIRRAGLLRRRTARP